MRRPCLHQRWQHDAFWPAVTSGPTKDGRRQRRRRPRPRSARGRRQQPPPLACFAPSNRSAGLLPMARRVLVTWRRALRGCTSRRDPQETRRGHHLVALHARRWVADDPLARVRPGTRGGKRRDEWRRARGDEPNRCDSEANGQRRTGGCRHAKRLVAKAEALLAVSQLAQVAVVDCAKGARQ